MSLWVSNRGEVACGKDARHGGMYLMAMTSKGTRQVVTVETPLDNWKLMPESVAKRFDLVCEACDREDFARPDPLPMGVKQAEGD